MFFKILTSIGNALDIVFVAVGCLVILAFCFLIVFSMRYTNKENEKKRERQEHHRKMELNRKNDLLGWFNEEVSDAVAYDKIADILTDYLDYEDCDEDCVILPRSAYAATQIAAHLCNYCWNNGISLDAVLSEVTKTYGKDAISEKDMLKREIEDLYSDKEKEE